MNNFHVQIRSFIIVLTFGLISAINAQVSEICDNGLDDDGDGSIDLNDSDCICEIIQPVSLIPNPSFEEIQCCPSNRAQLNCAVGWIQASAPTTDLIHSCGWFGFPNFPVPEPLPDGEGIMGFRDGRVINPDNPEPNWKEYAGACLNLPMQAGVTYRFEFDVGFVNPEVSPTIEITFFGAPSCGLLPFGGNNIAFGCPTNASGWIEMSSVILTGTSGWVHTSLEVTPTQDINTIAIGPSCRATTANVSTYYFFDNLVLADLVSFQLDIQEVGHPCNADFGLSVLDLAGYEYQWYKNGIAIEGANSNMISSVEEGDYQVRLSGDEGCRITRMYSYSVPVINEFFEINLCAEESYRLGNRILTENGRYNDILVSTDGCDSIVTIDITNLEILHDTINTSLFAGNNIEIAGSSLSAEGETIIETNDQHGCIKYIHVFIDYIDIFFPNVFTPNGDGQNDLFNVGETKLNIVVNQLIIYDRWGNKINELNQLEPGQFSGWDGTHNGQGVIPGVYTYYALISSENNQRKEFYGSVLVLN